MPKHTPGPYELTKHQTIFAPNGKRADGVVGFDIAEVYGDCGQPEDKANASLFVAAPELLEALVDALPLVEGFDDADGGDIPDGEEPIVAPVLRKMREAIAKAQAA